MSKSRFFFWLLIGFVAGVSLRSFFVLPVLLVWAVFVLGILLVILAWLKRENFGGKRSNVLAIGGWISIAIIAGVLRYDLHDQAQGKSTVISFHEAGSITITGVVTDEPDIRSVSQRLTVAAEVVTLQSKEYAVSGRMLITTERYPRYAYGDRIALTGRVEAPEIFDDFDYPSYLAARDIYSLMRYPSISLISHGNGNYIKSHLFDFKQNLEKNLERALPMPESALAEGLLLGSRSQLPEDVIEDFRITGTLHIIALSGFNISIIADNLLKLLRWFSLGPAISFWLSLAAIVLFTVMVGGSASIVRAAIMGILVLLARKEGRAYAATNALLFAGALMVFENPKILRFDVGFQLSFLATLGLIRIAPKLEPYFKKWPNFLSARDNLVSTLSAQIAVLPLLIAYFGAVSWVSPLANVFILAAISSAMLFSFLSSALGFLGYGASFLAAIPAYILLWYQITAAKFFAMVPFAQYEMGVLGGVAAVAIAGPLIYWLGRNSLKIAKARLVDFPSIER